MHIVKTDKKNNGSDLAAVHEAKVKSVLTILYGFVEH